MEKKIDNFVVFYVERNGGIMIDRYEVFLNENITKVEARYNELIQKENVYSANIGRIIKSTDY